LRLETLDWRLERTGGQIIIIIIVITVCGGIWRRRPIRPSGEAQQRVEKGWPVVSLLEWFSSFGLAAGGHCCVESGEIE